MEISLGGGDTSDLNTTFYKLGNGDETKKRKTRKEVLVSTPSKKIRRSLDDVEVDGSDDGFKTNGVNVNISGDDHDHDGDTPVSKRLRGSGGNGKGKFGDRCVHSPSGSVELKEVLQSEVTGNGDGSAPEVIKLNGGIGVKSGDVGNLNLGLTEAASTCGTKGDDEDVVKAVAVLDFKDEGSKIGDETNEISQNEVAGKDDANVSSSSLGFKVEELKKNKMKEISKNKNGVVGKLNGNFKRKNGKVMEIDGNKKQKEDPAVVGSFHIAKGEGAAGPSYRDSSLKRNCSSRTKRKRLGSSSEAAVKKVNSSSVDLDPDDDLEQNAARMLSSRFDPSCTGFALKNPSLALLSANEGEEETPSGEAQDRVLRPRKHSKGKGKGRTSRKRRHFYEIPSDDMDAHWFLNRKIKIFWPLDESWYFGLVNDYDAEKSLHHIQYDDRDEEWISLENERFKLLLLPSELPRKPNILNYITPPDGSTPVPVHIKDEAFRESEPIISWLANHRLKSSTSTCLKKQNTSRDACNTTEREADKLNCSSVQSVEEDRSNTGREEGHVPIVYVRRRRCPGFSDPATAASWSENNATRVLKLDTTPPLIQFNTFEICIPLWPMLTYYSLGADNLWLLRSVFLLQFGTMVTMWPSVFLEVLFVDNIVGLRLFLFEGYLKQAVAFIFLVMNIFCEPEKDESINHQIPVTSIRFKLSFFQNFRNHKVFAYYTFSKVRDFGWQYLDLKFQPHCSLSKHLSLSECTYDNVKQLEAVTQTTRIPHVAQTEVFRKKSNHGGISLLSSSRSSKPVPGTRTIYSLMHGNVPPFALSFTAAPNLFLSLHLKLLLERSISLAAADDDDDDEYDDDCSQFEISSESSSSKSSSHGVFFSHGSHHVAIDGMGRKSPTLLSDVNSNEAAGSSRGNNQPLRQFKDPSASNLKGTITVEIPASDEIYSDGIICSPNQHSAGPKSSSLWHHQKPFGDPWGDGKAEFISNGPKKPRTQVQYTLPYSNKNRGPNNLPYQRIRKTNDRKMSLLSSETTTAAVRGGGPQRNLELVACNVNILINGGDKGWRECGARVFLEADQQKEWKLSVKCNGELRYAYKVHQDLQPGSTNRYTHAMMWKGGKDWALEFPERSQWFVFKEMHEECHNRNIRAASIKNIPIPGVRLIQVDDHHHHQNEESFTRTPRYLRQARDDVEMAMDASHVMYDMDSEDERWVCKNRSKEDDNDDIISDELFEKVMDMLEKVSYAQKRDDFTSGEVEELIARVTPMQVAKTIYDYWREKRQRKAMPLVRQLQPPLWEKYQQICREWEKLKPKPTIGPVSGSQEKASAAAAADKPPMFAFCLKPRGLELLNRGSKHRPHKKISLSGHHLGDHDIHHSSGRRVHRYGFVGDERGESSDVSPLQATKTYSPREMGNFSLDGGDASDWNHQQLRMQGSKSVRTLVSPRAGSRKSSVKRNSSKKFGGDWQSNQANPYRMQQLVLGGSDLDEFRLRDASSAAKHARNMAKLKRERAEKLMLSADLAIHKAVSAIMTAEAIKASCTAGDNDEESSSPPSTSIS